MADAHTVFIFLTFFLAIGTTHIYELSQFYIMSYLTSTCTRAQDIFARRESPHIQPSPDIAMYTPFTGLQNQMTSVARSLVVCTAAAEDLCTAEDPRVGALIGAAALASALGLPFLVLNASPLTRLSLGLEAAKATVVSVPAPVIASLGYGALFREGFREGFAFLHRFNGGSEGGVLAWMEPEQQDVVRFLPHLAARILDGHYDLVVPRRTSFPSEADVAAGAAQYHAERFASLYLDAQMAACVANPPAMDWFFGVLLVRASFAQRWIQSPRPYEPRPVAMLLPLLHALDAGARLDTPEVSFVSTPRATAMAAWAVATSLVDPAAVSAAAAKAGQAHTQITSGTVVGANPSAPSDAGGRGPSLEVVENQWEHLQTTILQVTDSIRTLAAAAQRGAQSARVTTSEPQAATPYSDRKYALEDILPVSAVAAMRNTQPR